MVNDSNIPRSKFNWLKWLVGTAVSLITVGSSLIAILDYLDPHEPRTPLPNPGVAVLTIPASPEAAVLPTQTSLATETSTLIPALPADSSTAVVVRPESPTPQRLDPAAFVLSYWQNVSHHEFEVAWAQLSPEFRRAFHNDNFLNYLHGYQEMDICRIEVRSVNVVQQNDFSSIVQAHLTYYAGAQCYQSEHNFEMWLVYDPSTNSWLFDQNFTK